MISTEHAFTWRSRTAFVIITAGATLSLNDFLTFPAMAGQNGGGVFLLFYILFLFILGLPLMMAELMLGRLALSDPAASFQKLSEQYRASVYWKLIGLGSMLAAFLITASLCVMGGRALSYFFKSTLGMFANISIEESSLLFHDFMFDSERMALWLTLFIILLVTISAQELRKGLERICLLLVPLMIFLLACGLILAIYSSEFGNSVKYLLYADFSAFDARTPIVALQRAFYTLVLAVGVMIAFGRYLPRGISIGYSASLVIAIDLLFSIFTGLTINALIFSTGYEPELHNQFAFTILPVVFTHFDSAGLFAAMFYLLITLAALTTTIALMESPITYLQRKFDCSRLRAACLLGCGVWLFGMGVILAQSVWNGSGFTLALFFGDEAVRLVNNAGFDDVLIFFSNHLVQPFVALFTCIFVAWVIPREVSFAELAFTHKIRFEIWNYLIRYITPVLLLIVIIASLGIT